MRATGIVRRIDDLGRIVIPKEVRRNLGFKEGDPLEIFINKDNLGVTFRKFEIASLEEAISAYKGLSKEDKKEFLSYIFSTH